ncbi:MAG: hypothetical protein DI547_10115 [Sphingobium sp.]|jgi:uncharacterized membrane protein|nr:MAG: hypothetical protein DI547_10115 [Sphingobium sp.]
MTALEATLIIAATIGTGLIGGLFFAFSNFVLHALDRLPAAQAIMAMQRINATVLNPLFLGIFFGTAVIAVAAAALSLSSRGDAAVWLSVLGAALYVGGVVVVTMRYNVPLNNRLAAIATSHADPSDDWAAYARPWLQWNHVRTVASLIACASFACLTATGVVI